MKTKRPKGLTRAGYITAARNGVWIEWVKKTKIKKDRIYITSFWFFPNTGDVARANVIKNYTHTINQELSIPRKVLMKKPTMADWEAIKFAYEVL